MAGTSHADSCPQGSKITKKTCLNFILRKLQKLKLLSLSRHQSRIFFFHVEICISSRGFFFSRRDLYFKSSFFSCRDFYFKSRIFFFMSRFVFQAEFFISCREFFHVDIFLFKRRSVFIARREFCYLRGLSSGHFAIQGEMLPRSTCRHLMAMIKVIR